MIKIALIGNPNVGKSTLFNSLTGMHQHTGNWTGKTVGVATGTYEDILFYDLPGTYSLIPHSEEEKVTSEFVLRKDYDIAVVVCDALCLERNLNLVLQTLEVTDKVIMCVNLMDEASKKNIKVDIDKLSNILGIPVVGMSAIKNDGINQLISYIRNINTNPITISYPKEIEESINILKPYVNSRFEGISLLLLLSDLKDPLIKELVKQIKIDLKEKGIIINDEIANTKMYLINDIICQAVTNNKKYKISKIDKILTNKITGIPIMIIMLMGILYLSIVGANYPSEWLFTFFNWLGNHLEHFLLNIHLPDWFVNPIIYGIYRVLTWVVAVMLPPMAIFFPLFTLLEDLGVLPRIAFNLDGYFSKSNACGKQALTMCMGFGCNAVGVTGTRIIDSPREKLIAILTNSFVPCNGRFPALISLLTMFFIGKNVIFKSLISALLLTGLILIGIMMTLLVSKILSKTILKGVPSLFILELPPYRRPQIIKTIIRSIFDRTLNILGRAVLIAAPTGLIIYLLTNIQIGNISLLNHLSNFLDPFGKLIGLDGVILVGFILGITANEIVLPIIMMAYISTGYLVDVSNLSYLKEVLVNNNWTIVTALCTLIFIIFHFPCSTTLLTIKKETGSVKWTLLSFFLPLFIGLTLCFFISKISLLF